MQNRSNRQLLFGGRSDAANGGTTVGGSAPSGMELDAMEADNQAAVEGLRAPAARMKDIAMHIERDVNDQNRMLDRMDKRFDGASATLNDTLNRLVEMTNDRGMRRMGLAIGVFFLALLGLMRLLRR